MRINNTKEWKETKEKLEKGLRDLGEYPRVIRSGKAVVDGQIKFTTVVLEGGLNIRYSLKDREIIIWGVGKRYSNGYIEYEALKRKIDMFKAIMDGAEI